MNAMANDTQYGSAFNGGLVGNGFDVEIKRTGATGAMVCVTDVATKDEWMQALDVEPDTDLQALAVKIGNCPEISSDEGWIADTDWDENMTTRWNAA